MRKLPKTVLLCLACASAAWSDGSGVLLSSHANPSFALSADPDTKEWKDAPSVIANTSPFGQKLPEARTEIRSRWTDTDLYFLFICKYDRLYLKSQPILNADTPGLWDYDVAEVFLGPDLHNIQVYKEFEVSPQGEFVDLDIDRTRKGHEGDIHWDSGWHVRARIDREKKVWYGEMQIPWRAIMPDRPTIDQQFRLNLYRIEGGPENRKYIVWQVTNSPSFHTPESFGQLRLVH